MADTDLTPDEADADAAIPLYNGNAYDPITNPKGFDEDGHTVNLMPLTNHVRVMARLARRMALFVVGLKNDVVGLKGDVIGLKALTSEDASNTYQDRLATAQSVRDAADQVLKASKWASAPENTPVEAGGFSALHWAAKAAAWAAGVNLPPINSGEGGRYLQAKSDRSGFTLTALPFATQGEIDAGTGTGIVRADRLGVRLSTMQAGINAAAEVIPPVGAMLMLPKYGIAPSEAKWVPADGRFLSKAAYPELAAVLPPIPEGYKGEYGVLKASGYYLNISTNSSGSSSNVVHLAMNKITGAYAIIQAAWLRVYSAANNQLVSQAVTFSNAVNTSYDGTNNYRNMAIPLASNLVFVGSGGLQYVAYSSGVVTTLKNGNAASYGFMHQMPNGNILAFIEGATGELRCYRLLAGQNETVAANWVEVTPLGVLMNSPTTISWTDSAGRLYVITRPAGTNSGTNTSILRTLDGVTWETVASGLTFDQDPNYSHPGARNTVSAVRPIDEGKYESADGQRLAVRIGYRDFIFSTNGGASWSKLSGTTIFGNLTYDSGNALITCCYDQWENDFIFATYHVVSSTHRVSAVRTSNFAAFTSVVSAVAVQGPQNLNHTFTAVIALKSRRFHIFRFDSANGVGYRTGVDQNAGGVVYESSTQNASPYRFKVIGYPAEDIILITTIGFTAWLDPASNPSSLNHVPGDTIYHMIFPNNKTLVGTTTNPSIRVGSIYRYNPDTEIMLPNIYHEFNSASTAGQSQYFDWSRVTYVGFKHLIRVK